MRRPDISPFPGILQKWFLQEETRLGAQSRRFGQRGVTRVSCLEERMRMGDEDVDIVTVPKNRDDRKQRRGKRPRCLADAEGGESARCRGARWCRFLAPRGREFCGTCPWQICPSRGKMWLAALETQSTIWSQGSRGVSSAPGPPGAVWRRRVFQQPSVEAVLVPGWAPRACSSGWVPVGSWLGLSSANISKSQIRALIFNLLNNFWLFSLQ